MVRTALGASTKLAKVLVGIPHFVTAHCAIFSLDEDAAASGAVAIAASTWGTATEREGQISNRPICEHLKLGMERE